MNEEDKKKFFEELKRLTSLENTFKKLDRPIGVFQIKKSLFDENHIDCNRRVIKQTPFRMYHEFAILEHNLDGKSKLKISDVNYWIFYITEEKRRYCKACDFLKASNEEFKKDYLFIGQCSFYLKKLKSDYKFKIFFYNAWCLIAEFSRLYTFLLFKK